MKIYLVRHGEPAIENETWASNMDLVDFSWFVKNYRYLGIKPNDERAASVAQVLPADSIMYSSSHRRAVQTALAVTGQAEIKSDKLFRELMLPLVRLPGIRKCSRWWGLSVALRIFGFNRRTESSKLEKNRIRVAADKLAEECKRKDVVLFGHGLINYFLNKELIRNGWSSNIRGPIGYWGVVVLTKNS